ncbi:MAG: hypothetical protein EZS28_012724 [Streblomastix strix]|uniref:Right handed beta helix domain-containing protein n=1 Tax=Streblomastix strix TaxID=222440 RepID=A0A5J4WAB2_9EUKA|nr:MAG: hypothetical protein EZS28_012724 [Streblomastix strix]
MDKTTISSQFRINSTQTSPRTFTNNPSGGTTQSEIQIITRGQFRISGNSLFQHIKFTMAGEAQYQQGGAINASINGQSRNLEISSCSFVGCESTDSGGALYIYSDLVGLITIKDISFTNCNSGQGGAFFCDISSGTQMTISGKVTFDKCNSYDQGGGQYFQVLGVKTEINITGELEYKECEAVLGGGLCIFVEDRSTVEINKASFTDCMSEYDGGAIFIGGGIYLWIDGGIVIFNPTQQILLDNCNSQNNGGGIYCWITQNGQIQVNNMKISNCTSQQVGGGGIYANINEGGQLILDNLCEFYQCKSNGNGGGIYAIIDFVIQCKFLIKDAFFHECKALNNTSQYYSQSGFGGCLFLTGSGDYNPGSKFIDLHGMRIYGNQADKNGRSLFVAMEKIEEWCQFGTLGEYVKGNYSDAYSDESDLEEDESSTPISIEGEIPNDQIATFGMNEYKWLNYKQKVYSIVISNDRNIFTGKDGLTIEEYATAAVQLEVIIEEDDADDDSEIDDPEKEDDDKKDDQEDLAEKDGKGKGLSVGAIIGIVFGILAFIALIVILIIIIVVFASKKKKEKENKLQDNEQQLSDLSTIAEPSQSSANNNQMSQIKTPPLSQVNSQVQSSNITNSQVRSYDITNTPDQPPNISNPKQIQIEHELSKAKVHKQTSLHQIKRQYTLEHIMRDTQIIQLTEEFFYQNITMRRHHENEMALSIQIMALRFSVYGLMAVSHRTH